MTSRLTNLADETLAALVRGAFGLVRLLGPDRASNLGAAGARLLGPLTSAHRIARENIDAAFPEKTAEERAAILRESWENLGRTASEYVHLGALWDWDPERPNSGRIELDEASVARFIRLRDDGKPAILFAAHLANWELPAVAAQRNGLPSAALYRTPNNRAIARDILAMRSGVMGELISAGPAAPIRMMEALDAGLHLGMLVDQRFGRGPKIRFLGRTATANPLLARLARRFDVPVHGARAIRLPGNRFRLELTEAVTLPRDARGSVDVDAATQMINDIVADWIREHPGQWLWQHRRWRM
ncbi:lipid A biosynthesis lauroyl acyltransferase [Falsiroseomonas oryziterrae]|uniref:lipid A biosynthesis lauroyl acyltransferase n=1 Tax=Falsiroseomonas oryziterrae TaxID=2911368 RepID=UPI001F027BBE|nr:lipid A biosynthesis lauroyl acyltransferase [Roseomonas sp. NPKOSM-4]